MTSTAACLALATPSAPVGPTSQCDVFIQQQPLDLSGHIIVTGDQKNVHDAALRSAPHASVQYSLILEAFAAAR